MLHPDVAPSTSTGSQSSISPPEESQSESTQELPPFSSFLSDVRPLLSKPNQLKLQPTQSALGRQHRREYYTNHAGRTKRPRFNQQLQYCLKPEFCTGNNLLGWQTSRIYNPKHLSPLSTIGSTITGNHRTPSLMSLNPLAPAFLPSYQSSSNPPTSLCNSTTMGLLLAQLICGVPPQFIPSLAPPLITNITLTTLSSSPFSSRQISLSRMQKLTNQRLDLQLLCLHHSNTNRTAYRLLTKPSNSLVNT